MSRPWFDRDGEHQLEADEKASATYSSLRTGILSLTPGDNKCRLYCNGSNCKFCTIDPPGTSQAIPGLYSSWVTEDILAMARLLEEHFEKRDIVEKFNACRIQSVINLQESGEHSFCGHGVTSSGFSYDPEKLMSNGIFHYNFPLPDFEACSPNRLLDIVKVLDFAISHGRVAVHCHAGHGRTGMVISAWMMYALGYSPSQAVDAVRSKRAKAVQSKEQVNTLHEFRLLIMNNGGMIIPKTKCCLISDYVEYNQKFISKPESRLYGKIPKIVYTGMRLIFDYLFCWVSFEVEDAYRWRIRRGELREKASALDGELLDAQLNEERHDITYQWYLQQVKDGLSISTISRHLALTDFRDLIRLLDLFFHSSFHQLTYKEQLLAVLENADGPEKDWTPTFRFLLECVRQLPRELHFALSRQLSKWFIRSELHVAPKIFENVSSSSSS